MKLININIHRGEKLNELLSFFHQQDPDIVCMQEVYSYDAWELRPIIGKGARCYNFHNIFQANAQFPFSFFSPTFRSKGSDRDLNADIYFGNVIYSKYPFVKAQTHFYDILYDPDYGKKLNSKDPTEQPRNMQQVAVDVLGKELQIINTHGIWQLQELKSDTDRTLTMVDSMLMQIEKHIPTIIAGDFNLSPDTASIGKLEKAGYSNLIKKYDVKTTRNSKGHPEIIDYSFVSDQVIVKSFSILNSNVSDHLPLVLEFDV